MDITVDEDGTPHNLMDYATFRWCQKHRQVADSKQNMEKDRHKKSTSMILRETSKERESQIQKEADKEFIKASADASKMRRLYRLLSKGSNPEKMTDPETENNSTISRQRAKFLKFVLDKDLDLRAEIEEMVKRMCSVRLVISIFMETRPLEKTKPTPLFTSKTRKLWRS